MLAAGLGCVKCCQELLDKQASIDDDNSDGDTALHLASRYGHVPVVNLLMDYHADLATLLGTGGKGGGGGGEGGEGAPLPPHACKRMLTYLSEFQQPTNAAF